MIDRLGVWLSGRAVRKHVALEGKRLGDFGCGFEATFARSVVDIVDEVVLVDVSLADELLNHPKMRALEGTLPEVLSALPDASLDVVLCLSVLEHLWEPDAMLAECRRLLAYGGTLLINVPSWRGKRALEFSAFRLGLSPREEMDDHKAYYDPPDLWPSLVRAGFVPHNIRCFRHKFGLNTFAVCRAE
jgi:2-polyprenyl-3-methyl-5-hydroxy-6-metoxy-1,4-benzoquinol methylase